MNFITQTENSVKSIEIEKIKDGEVSEYLVRVEFEEKITPKPISIIWHEPLVDIFSFWSSKCGVQHNITPDWNSRKEVSRTASGMPLACLHSKADMNRVTVALSDPTNPSTLSSGVVEENGTAQMRIDLLSQLCPPMESYEVVIRIDKRDIPFYDAIKDVRKWWTTLGYECAYTPDTAKLPMYSTWYSFHQHTIPQEIINECKIAKEYGMDTVIVDDGWQTDDNSRGYAFCGDWQVCQSKIPDMKSFVDEIHKLGMKFMIWFSVPFVGFESKNYERFKGMYLNTRKGARASVLDPRFRQVRQFLVDIYEKEVKDYGWDGLKLDFIDSFELSEESSQDFDKMDTVSVEEAVQMLLAETTERLKKINPHIMIEFRQSYVGPAIAKYGNIFRVTDCPDDAIFNRESSLGLRLTSGTTAVHSDMLMWHSNDTNESVMHQLLSVMFAVPQISVRIEDISNDHKKLLKSYLDFWRKHRKTILDGELTVSGADAGYTMAKSKKDGESVAVLYQNVIYRKESTTTEYVFNSTGCDEICVVSDTERSYELYDIFGVKYKEGKILKGANLLELKCCQMTKIF